MAGRQFMNHQLSNTGDNMRRSKGYVQLKTKGLGLFTDKVQKELQKSIQKAAPKSTSKKEKKTKEIKTNYI